MHPAQALAFYGELRKHASVMQSVHQALAPTARLLGSRAVGLGAGLGGAVGAVGGGLRSAYGAYNDARDQGASLPTALVAGLPSGIMGALDGSIKGVASGASLGAIAHTLNPKAVDQLLTSQRLRELAHSGQGQMHSVFGVTPEVPGALSKTDALHHIGVLSEQATARGQQAVRDTAEKGLTSAPGFIKSLVTHPVDTVRTALADHWHTNDLAGKAFTATQLISPVTETIAGYQEQDPEKKHEHYGRAVGGLVGALPGRHMPMLGQVALGMGGHQLGGAAGAAIGRMRAAAAKPQVAPVDTQAETAQ